MLFSELNQSLQNYLVELGASTAVDVRKLMEHKAVSKTPLGFDPGFTLFDDYEDAVDACHTWLHAVLSVELMVSHESNVEASLILPKKTLNISLCDKIAEADCGDIFQHYELLTTPIGRIDYFTYLTIMEVKENPVQLLYRYFQDQLCQLHGLQPFSPYGLLSRDTLVNTGIADMLGVANFDTLWLNIDRFFGDMSEEDGLFKAIFGDDSQSDDYVTGDAIPDGGFGDKDDTNYDSYEIDDDYEINDEE